MKVSDSQTSDPGFNTLTLLGACIVVYRLFCPMFLFFNITRTHPSLDLNSLSIGPVIEFEYRYLAINAGNNNCRARRYSNIDVLVVVVLLCCCVVVVELVY